MPLAKKGPPRRGAATGWKRPCREHCIVWAVALDGQLQMRCAHCDFTKQKIDTRATYEPEFLKKQCERSQKAHKTHCLRLKRSNNANL